MKQMIRGMALAGLALVLMTAPALAGEGGTWVTDTGSVHAIHSGNAVFMSEDDAERFDLADLRDGETRTFGEGPRSVTVSRNGDEATISRTASGDDVSAINITCRLSDDTCTVLTFPDDPKKVMVAIEKERTCNNGEGDCDFSFGDHAGAEGHIVVDIECDGDDCGEVHEMHLKELGDLQGIIAMETEDGDHGNPSRIVIRRVGGEGGNDENVFVTRGDHSPGAMHRVHRLHGDNVVLRCSEGDATIRVKKEEAGETFLCPKHSTPMEAVKGHERRGVRVIRTGSPDEN